MISGTVSLQDYIAALRLHRARLDRLILVMAAAMVAMAAFVYALGFRLPGLALCAVGVGAFLGNFVQVRFFLPRMARRIYRQQESLRVTWSYSWDTRSISAASAFAQATRPWTIYTRILENDRLFLLYHSDVIFEILPKAWFRDSAQLQEFHALARGAPRD